jgi:hypothetical protein
LIVALLFASPERVFAQAPTIQLQASNYNGFNISCFGLRDGSIDLTVSGGVPPYTYDWSNGATTQDVSGLAAGFYSVRVTGANNIGARADLTLTEPLQLKGEASVFMYPNGYNVSCYQCFNGSIAVLPFDGVAPYGYAWMDGSTTQNRSNLGAVQTSVTITDANACEWRSEIFTLTSPERSDWTMSGNAGTNPATQYIGTSDNKDLVFKTNGTERLKLLSSGDLKLTLPGLGVGQLYRDPNGILRSGIFVNPDPLPTPVTPCAMGLGGSPYWKTDGNGFMAPQCDDNVVPVFGTKSANPIKIITNNETRMWFGVNGKVMIGPGYNDGPIGQYRLYVDDGIATRDVMVKLGTWPDYVFGDAYHLMPLNELRGFLQRNNHLPGIPSAKDLEEQGGVEVGDMQRRLLQVVEEQHLYILQLHERLTAAEQRLQVLEASK